MPTTVSQTILNALAEGPCDIYSLQIRLIQHGQPQIPINTIRAYLKTLQCSNRVESPERGIYALAGTEPQRETRGEYNRRIEEDIIITLAAVEEPKRTLQIADMIENRGGPRYLQSEVSIACERMLRNGALGRLNKGFFLRNTTAVPPARARRTREVPEIRYRIYAFLSQYGYSLELDNIADSMSKQGLVLPDHKTWKEEIRDHCRSMVRSGYLTSVSTNYFTANPQKPLLRPAAPPAPVTEHKDFFEDQPDDEIPYNGRVYL